MSEAVTTTTEEIPPVITVGNLIESAFRAEGRGRQDPDMLQILLEKDDEEQDAAEIDMPTTDILSEIALGTVTNIKTALDELIDECNPVEDGTGQLRRQLVVERELLQADLEVASGLDVRRFFSRDYPVLTKIVMDGLLESIDTNFVPTEVKYEGDLTRSIERMKLAKAERDGDETKTQPEDAETQPDEAQPEDAEAEEDAETESTEGAEAALAHMASLVVEHATLAAEHPDKSGVFDNLFVRLSTLASVHRVLYPKEKMDALIEEPGVMERVSGGIDRGVFGSPDGFNPNNFELGRTMALTASIVAIDFTFGTITPFGLEHLLILLIPAMNLAAAGHDRRREKMKSMILAKALPIGATLAILYSLSKLFLDHTIDMNVPRYDLMLDMHQTLSLLDPNLDLNEIREQGNATAGELSEAFREAAEKIKGTDKEIARIRMSTESGLDIKPEHAKFFKETGLTDSYVGQRVGQVREALDRIRISLTEISGVYLIIKSFISYLGLTTMSNSERLSTAVALETLAAHPALSGLVSKLKGDQLHYSGNGIVTSVTNPEKHAFGGSEVDAFKLGHTVADDLTYEGKVATPASIAAISQHVVDLLQGDVDPVALAKDKKGGPVRRMMQKARGAFGRR